MLLALGVFLLVFVAVLLLMAFVAITWDHDIAQKYAALPAPADLGTREFRWRCWLSPLTRRNWRTSILRSPCPRITLQCPFALLSADFAKLATSLSLPKLSLEQLPFLFPQIAIGSLFLQLFGNSHFPASVRCMRLKALTVVHLRPLDMSFPSQDGVTPVAPELKCIMVLTEKRFLEDEIEFIVQTDLLDELGTVWQSVTSFSIPFNQETLLVPLSVSSSTLDLSLVVRAKSKHQANSFGCSKRNLREFEEVSVVGVVQTPTSSKDTMPLMWMMGRATGVLQQQGRVPQLPMMCNCIFGEKIVSVPLQKKIELHSWISEEDIQPQKQVTKFTADVDGENVVTGILRTVGWVFPGQDEMPKQ
ncbi:unnamed protein product [Peronospora belbahrii]|uniref:SMP-LTD domain-containing protein n=1 Tax=Peronospora belbahrii TaxID=622444 RepID=A0AAU9KLV0_9STRA|nr:unnamed protein product [Peronospora belbahrii]CAH0518216.1 unnamed protein product [Peronospora belbahrii]